jgi:hypothetical protein
LARYAWDASVGALPDATRDVAHPLRPGLAGADAEKLADRELGAPVQDAEHLSPPVQRVLRDAAVELCRPGADQSAARSFSARAERAGPQRPEEQPVSEQPGRPEAALKQSRKGLAAEVERLLALAAQAELRDAVALPPLRAARLVAERVFQER